MVNLYKSDLYLFYAIDSCIAMKIRVGKTVDLNCEFSEISAQLNKIISDHFNIICLLHMEGS